MTRTYMIAYEQADALWNLTLSAGSWQEAVDHFKNEVMKYDIGYKVKAVWLLEKEFGNG